MAEDEPQREHVYLPWHFRHTLEGEKTFCGRIVYERPHHYFLLSDLERISSKIEKKPTKNPISSWERVLRALWSLCAGTAVPYIADWSSFKSIWEYLSWAISNTWVVLEDPVGTLRRRTIILIQALADQFGIKILFY